MSERADEVFELSDVEVETLRRAALERDLPFDGSTRIYRRAELNRYGLVREGYTTEELGRLGFKPGPVSCFDEAATAAQTALQVETPFGSGITKWQLPINAKQMRIEQTIFPPDSRVVPHVHPVNGPDDTGGGLRIVIKGKIFYDGREFGPGDWFFVPNGMSYAFTTDPDRLTVVMYKYAFFGDMWGNRFSHPSRAAEASHESGFMGEMPGVETSTCGMCAGKHASSGN